MTSHRTEDAFDLPEQANRTVQGYVGVDGLDNLAADLAEFQDFISEGLATTTFGPLDKYVAANDNVPQENDKLRRLFKGQLSEAEKSEIDDAMVGGSLDEGGSTSGFSVNLASADDIPKTVAGVRVTNEGRRSVIFADGSESYANGGYVKPSDARPIINRDYVVSRADLDRLHSVARYLSSDNVPVAKQPAPPRTGDFMQTFTGRQYWPMSPRPHEVYIEDIAHSLSLQCRYAGHCVKFYSVAEHSVLIARSLAATHAPEVALAGLLHDAPEAYCVDIPRPLKPYLTNYKSIEQDNWRAIAARFGLSPVLPEEVHDADNRIIADELVNLVPMPWHARHNNPLGVRLRFWSPEKAEVEFLATFDALMAGRAA